MGFAWFRNYVENDLDSPILNNQLWITTSGGQTRCVVTTSAFVANHAVNGANHLFLFVLSLGSVDNQPQKSSLKLLFQCKNTRQTCSSSVAATTSSASRFRPSESMDLESTEEHVRQCISVGRLEPADERSGLLAQYTSNADDMLRGLNSVRRPNWLATSAWYLWSYCSTWVISVCIYFNNFILHQNNPH